MLLPLPLLPLLLMLLLLWPIFALHLLLSPFVHASLYHSHASSA